jgi:Clp amino terminal domain, pathogenicity island component
MSSDQIGTEHLLLAMVTPIKAGGACQIIRALNADPAVIRANIKRAILRSRGPREDAHRPRVSGSVAPLRRRNE